MKNKFIVLTFGILSATQSFGKSFGDVLASIQLNEIRGTSCASINAENLCSRLLVPNNEKINGVELSPYYSFACVIEGTYTENDIVNTVSRFVPVYASSGYSASLGASGYANSRGQWAVGYNAGMGRYGNVSYGWMDFQEVDENCILNGTVKLAGFGALKSKNKWSKVLLAQSSTIEEAVNSMTPASVERSNMEIISNYISSGFNSDVLFASKAEQECADVKQKMLGLNRDGLASLAQCEVDKEKGQWKLMSLWPYDFESPDIK